jgi:hypothetical protein
MLNNVNMVLLIAALVRVGFFLSSQHDVQTNETFMTIHAYILLIAFVMSMPFMQDTDFGDQYEPGLVMATAVLDALVIGCMCLVMYAVAAGEGTSFGRSKEKSKDKLIHPELNPNEYHKDKQEMMKDVMKEMGKEGNASSVLDHTKEHKDEHHDESAPAADTEHGL